MTDDLQQQEAEHNAADQSAKVTSSTNNRRRLLKSAVAVPVIMTLHSGAALARTSNLIGVADLTGANPDIAVKNTGSGDQLVCLEPDPNEDQTNSPPYDLGENPMGHLEPNMDGNGAEITLKDQIATCQGNGGIVVSATAFNSISGQITGI